MTEVLRAENKHLQLRVAELEAEVQSLRESSVPFVTIEQQADTLINHSSIAHGPDTLEHLQSFSVSSILCDVQKEAPDQFHLFEMVGNTPRNAQSENVTVEEMKGLVSLCTLLNTRSQRAKGLQLLIAIMLIARATSKQVSLLIPRVFKTNKYWEQCLNMYTGNCCIESWGDLT